MSTAQTSLSLCIGHERYLIVNGREMFNGDLIQLYVLNKEMRRLEIIINQTLLQTEVVLLYTWK